MKFSRLAFLALLVIATPAGAKDIEESTALKVVGTGLMLADCAQTYNMMKKPHIYYEMNPLLGQHPSPQKILWTCAGTIATAHLVDHFLGPKWSNTGWATIIGLELSAVYNNYGVIQDGREIERSLGLGMNVYQTPASRISVSVPFDQSGAMVRLNIKF